jgi:coenzyme PQQ precursor peptide PqqA
MRCCDCYDSTAKRDLAEPLHHGGVGSRFKMARAFAPITWETRMTWRTPKIVEVQVGMEINMYVCATRK